MELRIDHFWDKIFCQIDECDHFEDLPKMVKCALALSHSNADVEWSMNIDKGIIHIWNI